MALLNSIIKAERPKKEGNSFGIVMVHYSRLIPSESNNYSVDNIRELANMIKLSGGVKQNLLARKKTPEEYELIAGHRRRLAVKYLVEEEGLEEFAMLPVHVEKSGDILSEIDLVLTNCGARERSDWEKMMEVTRLAELMKAMQTGTEEEQERFRQLFGRDPGMTGGRELRKLIADTLGLSETKVANLNHINSSLAPELKERFEGGEIGVSVANEAAGLPAEKQQELAKKPEIRLADVKAEKKKTVSESDTEEQIPGQTELLDIPEANLENAGGYCENGSESEESTEEMAVEPLSAYGTPKRVYPPDSLITEEGCEGGHDCFSCAMDCRIRQKDRHCREAPLGNPFPCEVVKDGFTELPEGCQFLNHDLAYHCAGSGEPNPCCKDCQDPCEYICGRAMKALDQEAVISESDQKSNQEYWNPDEEDPDERYNLGDFPQAKDKYLDKLAQLMVTYMGNRMITFGGPSHMQDEAIEEKLRIFANESGGEIWMSEGVTTYPCGEFIEFIRGEEDLGISSFSRFANHVRKVMEIWTPQISESADDTDLELVNKMLEKEKGNLDDMERVLQAEPDPTLEKLIREKRLLVRALDGLLGEMDHPEKEKPEQPDLPNLKNNDQRKQFLETFRDWPVWFEVPEAAEVYYRYDLPDGCSLVICEYHYWVGWRQRYGEDPEGTGTKEYLLTPGYHYLEDCNSNRTAMVEKLKEIQKGGKG